MAEVIGAVETVGAPGSRPNASVTTVVQVSPNRIVRHLYVSIEIGTGLWWTGEGPPA
jgi:hypothetical protein